MKHFKLSEFDSPDLPGSGKNMDVATLERLDTLRELVGKPFIINSGFRTAAHNRKVGGAPNSAHRLGKAVDVSTLGWSEAERMNLITLARKNGFTGVGVGQSFIHLHTMPRVASWGYSRHKTVRIKVGREADFV